MKAHDKLFAYIPLVIVIILAMLKLTHLFNLSWWWVFFPLWGPIGVLSMLLFIPFIFATIAIVSLWVLSFFCES